MKCWHCNDELIWGGDHDAIEESGFIMVTNLTCPTCESYVEVHLPEVERDIKTLFHFRKKRFFDRKFNMTPTHKYGHLHFPMGSGGNHVRWLLFLDTKFTTDLCDNTLDSKLEFIKTRVYPLPGTNGSANGRTWNNWLDFEWTWRKNLDQLLLVTHNDYMETEHNQKELFLDVLDPYPMITHYNHINLGSSSTSDKLLKRFRRWQKEVKQIRTSTVDMPNKKVIYVDGLHEKILSKSLYQELIEFYQLDNNYDHACNIQERYYQCRLNSQKGFYNYFTGEDFQNYLSMLDQRIKQGILTKPTLKEDDGEY